MMNVEFVQRTRYVEEMTLRFQESWCPLVISDVGGHQSLTMERSPADKERHDHGDC